MREPIQRFFTPQEVERRVRPFFGSRTGLLSEAVEVPAESGRSEIFVYVSTLAEVTRLDDRIEIGRQDGLHPSGAGAAESRELARTRAYCEGLERYCAMVFDPDSLVVATREELGEAAVDLELFPRCSAAEHKNPRNFLSPPSNRARMRWVQGYSLLSGESRWIPAAAVYIGAGYVYAGEAFTIPITTGCALAASLEQALVTGICEVAERDSLMIAWLHRLPLPEIDLSGCGEPGLLDRLERARRAGFETRLFDATTDLGVPTVIAVQLARNSRPAVLVMAATRLEGLSAALRVLDESVSSRHAVQNLSRSPLRFDPHDFGTFTRLTDGAVFYADPANLPAFDFLLEGSRPGRSLGMMPSLVAESPEVELERLVEIFREKGTELLAVDLTHEEIRAEGFRVVKVIAPQLMPLITNHNMRFTATPRLREAPLRMGYPAASVEDLNPWAQPFA